MILFISQATAVTPIEALKKVWVTVVPSPYVQTEQDDWIKPEDQNTVSDNLDFWKERLQYEDDRNRSRYIVIPKLWVIAPMNNIYEDNPDYIKIKNWKSFELNKHLQAWILRYPMTANPGTIWNMVLFGHSSYFKSDRWRYKTIFTTIALLDQWDKIRIYERKWSTSPYVKYEYRVFKWYETKATDLTVMQPTTDATLSLVGCTPIWTADKRYIIKAKLTTKPIDAENQAELIIPTVIPDTTVADTAPISQEISVIGAVTQEDTIQEKTNNTIEDGAASLALISQHQAASEEIIPSEVSVSEDISTEIQAALVEKRAESEPQDIDNLDISAILEDTLVTESNEAILEVDYILMLSTTEITKINDLAAQINNLSPESQKRVKNILSKYFIHVHNRMPAAENLAGYLNSIL